MKRAKRWLAISLLLSGCASPPHRQTAINGIHLETIGRGEPLLFLHGGFLDSRIWEPQEGALGQHFSLILFDRLGAGESQALTRPYSPVESIKELLDAQGIDRVTLVGQSMGARIAIEFALEHPERVKALILASPGLNGFTFSKEHDRRLSLLFKEKTAEKMLERWLADPYMSPAMHNPEITKRVRDISAHNIKRHFENDSFPLLWPKTTAASRLSKVRARTLILVGTKDVPEILSIAELLKSKIPHAKKISIEGSGHLINMERPEVFNRLVIAFLKS